VCLTFGQTVLFTPRLKRPHFHINDGFATNSDLFRVIDKMKWFGAISIGPFPFDLYYEEDFEGFTRTLSLSSPP